MISTIAAASNPAMFSNPITGAIAAGAILAPMALKKIHQGSRTANKFTQGGPEAMFGQRLAEIEQLSHTDPEEAARQLTQEWNNFNSAAQSWIAKGGNEAKVARQALSNSKLIQTVDTLASQLGVPGVRGKTGDASLSSIAKGNSFTGDMSEQIPGGFGTPAMLNLPALAGLGQRSPSIATPGINPNAGMPNVGSGGTPGKAGPWDWLTDNLGQVAVTGGLNLLGGYLGSRAANKASQIQVDAANRAAELQRQTAQEALALQKQMFLQSQANIQPWLNRGNEAGNRQQYLMGLPGSDQTLSNIAGMQ